jgi:hypothetical protein
MIENGTHPAHTAASSDGEMNELGGMTSLMGASTPAFRGMSVPMRVRRL